MAWMKVFDQYADELYEISQSSFSIVGATFTVKECVFILGVGFLVFSIAGGGLVKIADYQIGRAGMGARVASFSVSVILLVVYALLPSANLGIVAVFSDAVFKPAQTANYEFQLTPYKYVSERRGSEGVVIFSQEEKIRPGKYRFSVYRKEPGVERRQVLLERPVTIGPDHKDLIVRPVQSTPVEQFNGGYRVITDRAYSYFLNEYKKSKHWIDEISALNVLTRIVGSDGRLRSQVKSDLVDMPKKKGEVATAYIVGHLECSAAESALLYLAGLDGGDSRVSIYDRVRAAVLLNGCRDSVKSRANQFLDKTVALESYRDSNDEDIANRVRMQSALLMARELKEDGSCIRKGLHDALFLTGRYRFIAVEAERLLKNITGQSDPSSVEGWQAVLSTGEHNIEECEVNATL